MSFDDPAGRLCRAVNSQDLDQVADCFTPDCLFQIPHQPLLSLVGAEGFRERWIDLVQGRSHIKAKILRTSRNDDEFWVEWEVIAINLDGLPAILMGPSIMTLTETKISWARFYLVPAHIR